MNTLDLYRRLRSARKYLNCVPHLLSIYDVVIYCYVALATGFWWWFTGWVAFIVISMVFPATRSNFIFVAACITLVLSALKWIIKRNNSEHSGPIEISEDKYLARKIKGSMSLSDHEKEGGFQLCNSDFAPDGPIIISERFNRNCMSNPDWDATLTRDKNDDRFAILIMNIRGRSRVLSRYLWKTINTYLLTNRPLTNDSKVGFYTSCGPNANSVGIYETDYFTAQCTGELTVTNITTNDAANQRKYEFTAAEHARVVAKPDGTLEAFEIENSAHPCSLHGGVSALAISKDFYLRLSIQSKHVKIEGGKRQPLASGSMDWEDQFNCNSLKTLVERAATRELEEEWGKKHPMFPPLKIEKIYTIGFFRLPHRGGKPEFVVLAKLKNDDAHLRADETEVVADLSDSAATRFFVPTFAALTEATAIMLAGGSSYSDSVSLYGALRCLDDAIRLRPDLVRETIGYPPEKAALYSLD